MSNFCIFTAIEKVHVKFCKFIMGVNKKTIKLAVKGELGRFPISFSCIIQAFKYRYHLPETSNSLLHEAASVSNSLHNNGISTWFSFNDRVNKYINAKVDDPSAVVTLLSFLCEKFRVYWGNTISSFSKLDTYRSYKSSFCMVGYLDTISNRSHRVCYSKMRIGNHRFAIETGRFRKIPTEERGCLFCKKQSIAVIEDEKHIVFHWPLYEQYRKQLYGSVDELCPNFKDLKNHDQLNFLLNSDGPIVKAVARFFYLANLMHSSVSMN